MTFYSDRFGPTAFVAAEMPIIRARNEERKRISTGTSTSTRQTRLGIAAHSHIASVPHIAKSNQPSRMRRKAWATANTAPEIVRPSLKVCGIGKRWMPVRTSGVMAPSNARSTSDLILDRGVARFLSYVIVLLSRNLKSHGLNARATGQAVYCGSACGQSLTGGTGLQPVMWVADFAHY